MKQKNNVVLGIDVSTSCTGLTILDNTGNILLVEALDFKNKKKYPTLFDKAKQTELRLKQLYLKYNIDKVVIESALHMFTPGASSANTISLLMKFNGIVSWLVYSIFNFQPEYISASSARKLCGIKIPKGQKAKKVVMDYLIANEPQFKQYIKYTRTGSISPNCYDMADSFVIAKSSIV